MKNILQLDKHRLGNLFEAQSGGPAAADLSTAYGAVPRQGDGAVGSGYGPLSCCRRSCG